LSVAAHALQLLRQRDTGGFLLGRFVAILGWQMLAVAVGWHVYSLTHDPLALGIVGLSEFLPFVLLVLVGGHVADHANRRTVVVSAYMLTGVCLLGLFIMTLVGLRHAWPIYIVLGVFGATRAFWAPAMQAMLPRLVPREQFAPAVALNALLFQVAVVIGPALGGLLFLAGPQVVYGTTLLLFVLTITLLVRVRFAPPGPLPPTALGTTRRFLEGLRFVAGNRIVLGVMSLDLFAVLFGGAVALLPFFAAEILHAGPVGLGILRSAPGVGAALAGGFLAMRPLQEHAGRWLLGGVAMFGLCMIGFGLSSSFLLSGAALLLSGAGDMVSVYVRAVVVPLNTPDAIRGRVMAVNSMFIGASNELGEFESGLTASWFGIVPSVVIGGVLTLVVAGSWSLMFPALRRLGHLR
jgi:MFS family permease